jgi:O-antigen/teichoic acid export membrane protein
MGFLIPTFLLNSTLPMLKQKDNPKLLGKTMLSVLVLGSLSSLFALLWARPIMQLLTTDAYLATPLSPGSDTALMMMSVPLLLTGCITYGFYVLLHLHAWRQLVTILCGGAGISLIMNIFLIPRYGFVGAATTSIVIHILLACSLLLYALHVYPISLSKNSLFQWALFSVLLCVLLWLMRPFLVSEIHTIIGLIIISFLIGILLRITGIFRSLWV